MEFNRFDISTKELVWDDPAAWLEGLGIGPRAFPEQGEDGRVRLFTYVIRE